MKMTKLLISILLSIVISSSTLAERYNANTTSLPTTELKYKDSTRKLKRVLPTGQAEITGGSVANSGPTKYQNQKTPVRGDVMAMPPGRGPNLVVTMAYENDACAVVESFVGKGIYDAICDLHIRVKNIGDTATSLPPNGGFSLDLSYFNYKGEIRKGYRSIKNLGPNEEELIVYQSSSLRSFKPGTSFTATVDRKEFVTESNENDNRTVFWLY
jgi:hypothetical protein